MSQNGSILSGGAVSYALSAISTKEIDLDLKTTKKWEATIDNLEEFGIEYHTEDKSK